VAQFTTSSGASLQNSWDLSDFSNGKICGPAARPGQRWTGITADERRGGASPARGTSGAMGLQSSPAVIPHSEIAGTKPPYVCPGCFIHTYSNNMIIDSMFSNISTYSLQNDTWVQRKLHPCSGN
jgi:hypothetical protein